MSKPPPPPKAPPKAPPPPKAPAGGGGGSGELKAQPKALLGSIEGFKKGGLKKVQTVDKSGPLIEKKKDGGGGGPLNIPMAAPGGPPGRKNAPAPPSAGGGGMFPGGVPKLPSKRSATAAPAPAAAGAATEDASPQRPSRPAPPAGNAMGKGVAVFPGAGGPPMPKNKPQPPQQPPQPQSQSQSAPASAAAPAKKPPPNVPKKPAAAAAAGAGGPQCRALYAYTAARADELTFDKGAVITVLGKNADGWWNGSWNGREGLFPGNYVEEIAAAPAPAPPPRQPSAPQAEAKFDYAPAQPDELQLRKGDIITVLEKNADGWWKGSIGGRTGLFPANYVTERN